MDKDEDIEIIEPTEGHANSDSPPTFIIKSGTDENPQASHHALFQAYEDMKRRHQQLKSQNEILQQTIREMEYSRQTTRNNSNLLGAAGPIGASPGAEEDNLTAQAKAQIGYAESVQRQLMRAQAKILALENENKDLNNKLQSSSQLIQLNNDLNLRISTVTEKNKSLNREIVQLKQVIQDKERQIQEIEKQKDPIIMEGPFLLKINELKNEVKDKDDHISALTERLSMVKTADHRIYEQSPESGYNTRMNDDQNLLTVEESKQILTEIDNHKKTLKKFLHQLQYQTDTIHKQGQIIQELRKRAVSSNNVRVQGDGKPTSFSRDPASSWPTTSYRQGSPARPSYSDPVLTGAGARPKNGSYNLTSRVFDSDEPKATILSPTEDNGGVTINTQDNLFGLGGRQGNDFSRSYENYRLSVDQGSRNYMPSEVGSKFSPSILIPQQTMENSGSVFTPMKTDMIKDTKPISESSQNNDSEQQKLTGQVCPVCNREFRTMTMEDFQQHVFECIDDGDDEPPKTLQNPTIGDTYTNEIDRICPMCNKAFSNRLPLADFEKHVQEHFNEEPIVDRFEVLHP